MRKGFQKVGEKFKEFGGKVKDGLTTFWKKAEKGLRTAGGWFTRVWAKTLDVLAPIVKRIPPFGPLLGPLMKAQSTQVEVLSKGIFGTNGNGTGSFTEAAKNAEADLVGYRDKDGKLHADGKNIAQTILKIAA